MPPSSAALVAVAASEVDELEAGGAQAARPNRRGIAMADAANRCVEDFMMLPLS
jgi:hypothetical protein